MAAIFKPKLDLSLDIETTGLKPGCGVWQIGCVVLEEGHPHFKATVHPASAMEPPWSCNNETIKWQMEKNSHNWNSAFVTFDCQEVITTLVSFADWYHGLAANYDIRLWTKGPHFDIAILDAAYDRIGFSSPWKYNSIRDMRTLESLFPDVKVPKPDGTHDALVDAQWQAAIIKACLERLEQMKIDTEALKNFLSGLDSHGK